MLSCCRGRTNPETVATIVALVHSSSFQCPPTHSKRSLSCLVAFILINKKWSIFSPLTADTSIADTGLRSDPALPTNRKIPCLKGSVFDCFKCPWREFGEVWLSTAKSFLAKCANWSNSWLSFPQT